VFAKRCLNYLKFWRTTYCRRLRYKVYQSRPLHYTVALKPARLLCRVNDRILIGDLLTRGLLLLPARRYASAGLCDSDVSVRPSVRLSVRPSVCPSVTRRYCA